jgi:putative glutamine amidotransferase
MNVTLVRDTRRRLAMARKPLIGITTDFFSAADRRPAYSVTCAGYYDSISAAGGLPLLMPPLEQESDLEALLARLDGVLLIGGRDLDPQNDGFMLHPAVRPMDGRRETFDRMLARQICERQIPVFGIGAGMQLINVAMGGNLFLHIPEDLPTAIPHKDPLDQSHRHGLNVTMERGSVMERVYGDGEIRVNSMHHMAVDEVAPGFAVTARCPDGVVEAIESRIEGWTVIGTQFHPESNSASALDLRIFEEFIDAVRQPVAVLKVA